MQPCRVQAAQVPERSALQQSFVEGNYRAHVVLGRVTLPLSRRDSLPACSHQVGGHQRPLGRKRAANGSGSGGGGNAGRSGGSGGGGADCEGQGHVWRLTPAQEATLKEAYSEEPGTAVYVPDAAAGWRKQKQPWTSGQVRRLAAVHPASVQ